MQTYDDISHFLEHLAQGVEEGKYTKATFIKALEENEWVRLICDLDAEADSPDAQAIRDTPVRTSLVKPFQFLGMLPATQAIDTFKYCDLSRGLSERLGLIKMAKEHIKDFTATRH